MVECKGKTVFAVEPRRWRIEETFGILGFYRWLSMDREGSTPMPRTMILLATLFMTDVGFERQIMA